MKCETKSIKELRLNMKTKIKNEAGQTSYIVLTWVDIPQNQKYITFLC